MPSIPDFKSTKLVPPTNITVIPAVITTTNCINHIIPGMLNLFSCPQNFSSTIKSRSLLPYSQQPATSHILRQICTVHILILFLSILIISSHVGLGFTSSFSPFKSPDQNLLCTFHLPQMQDLPGTPLLLIQTL